MKIRADIPVILCTGFGGQISIEQAHNIINEVIMKPTAIRELSETIESVLLKVDQAEDTDRSGEISWAQSEDIKTGSWLN